MTSNLVQSYETPPKVIYGVTMAAPPLWLHDFILATKAFWLFTVSYGQVTMMFDVFCFCIYF